MVWTAQTNELTEFHEQNLANYALHFPPDWINRHSARSLWIESYRIPYPPGPNSPSPPRSADLGQVCATFLRSVLVYQAIRSPAVDLCTPEGLPEIEMHPPQMQIPLIMDEWVPKAPERPSSTGMAGTAKISTAADGVILVMHNVQIMNHRSNLGTFVILATPHHSANETGDEQRSKDRLKTAAGLLGAVMGKNSIYEPMFSFEIDLNGHPINIGSINIENPASFRIPNLSEAGLGLVESVAARILASPATLRGRAELSLRWLYQAMSDEGVLSFLKYWIAIETLAMPDTSNIKPVNRLLAVAYNCSDAQAKSGFAVGRLFDLRGQIVHGGSTFLIGQDLLSYIEAVYVDILAQTLGLKSGQMAAAALARCGHTAEELTQAATPVARRRLRVQARASADNHGVKIIDLPGGSS